MANARISPIGSKDRIQVIDILRGIALLGIIMVNVHEISGSWHIVETTGGAVDRFADFVTNTFFLNKFYTLFSFLFGLGMAIQMTRAEQKGISFPRLYLQRLLWLLLFGLMHAVFVWDGDILATYALIALFLLLLRKLKPKTLMILSIILILAQTGKNIMELEFGEVGGAEENQAFIEESKGEINFFRNASYAETTRNRFENTFEIEEAWLNLLAPLYVLYEGFDILGAFLFGLAVGKLSWFNAIDAKLALWKWLFRWAFPLGLGINILGGYLALSDSMTGSTGRFYDVGMLLLQLGAPPLTLGYISGIVLLSRKYKSLSSLAPPGKMALTVYLTQSIILTLLFYSYGLGLYGAVGTAAAMLIAVMIYVIQVLLSVLWMRHFRFGPFEWLWRSLTYRKFQPIRR